MLILPLLCTCANQSNKHCLALVTWHVPPCMAVLTPVLRARTAQTLPTAPSQPLAPNRPALQTFLMAAGRVGVCVCSLQRFQLPGLAETTVTANHGVITDAIVKKVPPEILSNSYLGYGVNFTSCCDDHDKCATQPQGPAWSAHSCCAALQEHSSELQHGRHCVTVIFLPHLTTHVACSSCYGIPGASKDTCDTTLRDCLRNNECTRIPNANFENIENFLVKEDCQLKADLFYNAVRCAPAL